MSVNFTISQLAGGRSTAHTVTNIIPGQTGLTISGPSSLTVYSQAASNFNNWLLNSSVTITATVTLGMSIGTFNGTIEYPTQNLVQGIVYFTISSTGSTGSVTHSFSHSCTSSTCPFLYLTVWDNFTTGPTPLSFTGTVTTNSTHGWTHAHVRHRANVRRFGRLYGSQRRYRGEHYGTLDLARGRYRHYLQCGDVADRKLGRDDDWLHLRHVLCDLYLSPAEPPAKPGARRFVL